MTVLQVLLMTGGLMVVLVLGYLALSGPSPDKEGSRRLQALRYRHAETTTDRVEAQLRKAVAARKPQARQIAGSQSRLQALALRLHRTGKGWTLQTYAYACGGLTLTIALLVFLRWHAPMLGLGMGLVVGLGLPHMVVNFFVKKRKLTFTTRFPDAIDLLVRGLRSGLPVGETLGVIATEIPGPTGEEFKLITERMKIGRTMDDALLETADRLDTPEFNFFVITLAIQRETGGNLAETLSNLGDVLRKRAQMKLKIRAMSSESKASAYIVGSLPFIVFGMIYWINPNYLGGFFTDDRLIIIGLGGAVWMSMGAFIMAKMVSFEI